jgi:hypothetical protein
MARTALAILPDAESRAVLPTRIDLPEIWGWRAIPNSTVALGIAGNNAFAAVNTTAAGITITLVSVTRAFTAATVSPSLYMTQDTIRAAVVDITMRTVLMQAAKIVTATAVETVPVAMAAIKNVAKLSTFCCSYCWL